MEVPILKKWVTPPKNLCTIFFLISESKSHFFVSSLFKKKLFLYVLFKPITERSINDPQPPSTTMIGVVKIENNTLLQSRTEEAMLKENDGFKMWKLN